MARLIVHAAAVIAPGGRLLLMGHSAAGKSTTCRLLQGRFPTFADDVICLDRKDGEWCISDAKSMMDESTEVPPLRALLRIFQSDAPQLIPAASREKCHYLMNAVCETQLPEWLDAHGLRAWFGHAADVARRYAGWHLWFNLDS